MNKMQDKKKKMKISTILIFLFCCIMAFIMLVPFVWMVSASFKTNTEIFEYPVRWIPRVFRSLNYEKVWNELSFAPENTVSVHIRRIREKIEINPKEPRYLKVVWGIGYKIEKI